MRPELPIALVEVGCNLWLSTLTLPDSFNAPPPLQERMADVTVIGGKKSPFHKVNFFSWISIE